MLQKCWWLSKIAGRCQRGATTRAHDGYDYCARHAKIVFRRYWGRTWEKP